MATELAEKTSDLAARVDHEREAEAVDTRVEGLNAEVAGLNAVIEGLDKEVEALHHTVRSYENALAMAKETHEEVSATPSLC